MAIRTLTKLLAGVQDMLWGRGTATQVRNGTSYNIERIQKIHPVDLLVDLKALPTLDEDAQYFEVVMKGTTGINDGNGGIFYFDAASTTVPDDLNVIRPDDRPSGAGRWIKQISDAVLRTGDTMTGQLKGITPVAANDLARKDYVDAAFNKHLIGPLATGMTASYASGLDDIAKNSVYSGNIAVVGDGPALFTSGNFVVTTTIASSASTDSRIQKLRKVQTGEEWYRYTVTGSAGWSDWLILSGDADVSTTAVGGTGVDDGDITWSRLIRMTPVNNANGTSTLVGILHGNNDSNSPSYEVSIVINSLSGSYDAATTEINVRQLTGTTPLAITASDFYLVFLGTAVNAKAELWIRKLHDYNSWAFKTLATSMSVEYFALSPWQAAVPYGPLIVPTIVAPDTGPTIGTAYLLAEIDIARQASIGTYTSVGSANVTIGGAVTVVCTIGNHQCYSSGGSVYTYRILINGVVEASGTAADLDFGGYDFASNCGNYNGTVSHNISVSPGDVITTQLYITSIDTGSVGSTIYPGVSMNADIKSGVFTEGVS